MGPDNVLMGDLSTVDLPQMQVDEQTLVDEKKLAKFSRTAEFKRLKEWCEGRIEFYQTKLPNGAEVGLDVVPSAEDWRVANRVIGEFRALLNQYELAKDIVDQERNGQ
jgi:hypothetical protein